MIHHIPMFSVVIPCYNRVDLLRRAAKSCIDQTFDDFEIIVVDDGSTDDVKGAVNEFNDQRLIYIRQEKAGGSAARNAGFQAARSNWIALLDADDYFLPEKLQIYKRQIETKQADLIFSYAYIDRGVGVFWSKPDRAPRKGEDITEYLFSSYQRTSTSTFVVRKNVALAVLFDEGLPLGQDIDFKVRLTGLGYSILMIEEPLSVYDDISSGGRVSRSNNGHFLEFWLQNNRKYFTRKGYYGYRATVLSKYIVHKKPLTAFRDILLGPILGGVSVSMTVRRSIRVFAPSTYNRIVALVMKLKGKSRHFTSGTED